MRATQATETITTVTTARRLHRHARPARQHADQDRIRIATLERGDAEAVLAMLGRCSPATLYHRFHGVTDGLSHATQVLAGATGQDAYGAWSADSCVGLACLAVSSDGSADIGVLVEDGWKRRGVGSALVLALVGRARERQLTSLVADVLADDQYILPLLARIGPVATSLAYGGYTVRVGLEPRTAASSDQA
ncbi:MAG TPA: GNAT family N-acetyltransferase, partial [Acidimicrobiales bacterium]|nr:GNAT family N-acetyltransferase [Acidimicrobiales bacterium]